MLREEFLTSNVKALMGYVYNQANIYSFKGERFLCIREVIKRFESYLPEARLEIFTNRWHKNSSNDFKFQRSFVLVLKKIEKGYGKRSEAISKSTEIVDWKAMMHASRIIYQALFQNNLEVWRMPN